MKVELYSMSLDTTLREKYPNTEFFFELNTEKYGPEITPYLVTFHAVLTFQYGIR